MVLQHPWLADGRIIHHGFDGTLNLSREHTERSLLVVGPYIPVQTSGRRYSSYLSTVLEGIIEQCVGEGVIDSGEAREDLCLLLQKRSLLQALYRIEEYLPEKKQVREYLRNALLRCQQVTDFHRSLVQIPSSGYITATQDTSLEAVYQEIHHYPLQKFYPSNIQEALDAAYQRYPFIIKLYGDIEKPNTLELNHRIIQYPFSLRGQEVLEELLALFPAIFVGFQQAGYSSVVLHNAVDQESTAQKAVGRLPQSPEIHQDLETITPEQSAPKRGISVFVVYDRMDEKELEEVKQILNTLSLQGWDIISYEREVAISTTWKQEDYHRTADLVLLLVSRHFVSIPYCYSPQLKQAVQRHKKDGYVLPIILGSCMWKRKTPFAELDALPKDGTPVNIWSPVDDAWYSVAEGVEQALQYLQDRLG